MFGVVILVDCIHTPLLLGFNFKWGGSDSGYYAYMWSTFSFFVVGIILDLFTGFWKKGCLVMNQGLCLRKYLKTWFIVDFIAVVPWTEMVTAMSSDQKSTKMGKVGKIGKLAKFLRVARMLRLTRLIKGMHINGYEVGDLLQILGILGGVFKLVIVFFFTAHCLACIWGGVGYPWDDGLGPAEFTFADCGFGQSCEPGTFGSPWIRRYGYDVFYAYAEEESYSTGGDDSRRRARLLWEGPSGIPGDLYESPERLLAGGGGPKMDLGPIYLRALQWAMSSMTTGGSNMDAGTVEELLVAIIAMLCSIFFACWFLYSVTQSAWNVMEHTRKKKAHFKKIRHFLGEVKVPSTLQARLVQYRKAADLKHSPWEDALEVFAFFPPGLRAELEANVYMRALKNHPFFMCLELDSKSDPHVMRDVAGACRLVSYQDTDVILSRGSFPIAMAFVLEGDLVLTGGVPQVNGKAPVSLLKSLKNRKQSTRASVFGVDMRKSVLMQMMPPEDHVAEGQFQVVLRAAPKNNHFPFIGDLALFTRFPKRCSHTVVATSDAWLLQITRNDLNDLLVAYPLTQHSLVRFKDWMAKASRDERGLRCDQCMNYGPGHIAENCPQRFRGNFNFVRRGAASYE
jgi:hypothetical protein